MFNPISSLINRFYDQEINLAVTGLSRAGKTAFITSLVNQLLKFSKNQEESHFLPAFSAFKRGQIISVKLVDHPNSELARFDYDGYLQALRNGNWPKPTSEISQISLLIKYKTAKSFFDRISHLQVSDVQTLKVNILDYPGEWLLDLPMLRQDYRRWSISHEYYIQHKQVRAVLAKPFVDGLANLDLYGPLTYQGTDAELVQRAQRNRAQVTYLVNAYKEYLRQAKKAGLEYIQPGRFVLPGDTPAARLDFFPLLLDNDEWKAAQAHAEKNPQSVAAYLFKQYDNYVKIVKDFYQRYFTSFNRQIILADCLRALNQSAEAFEELKKALEEIYSHFNYGHNSFFQRLFNPQVDKLMFAATKADHVTSLQLENLTELLKNLCEGPANDAKFNELAPKFIALGAIRATEQVAYPQGYALRGKLIRTGLQVDYDPGLVPKTKPSEDFWRDYKYEFEEFLPLPLDGDRIRSINMDLVLEFFFGDHFAP